MLQLKLVVEVSTIFDLSDWIFVFAMKNTGMMNSGFSAKPAFSVAKAGIFKKKKGYCAILRTFLRDRLVSSFAIAPSHSGADD